MAAIKQLLDLSPEELQIKLQEAHIEGYKEGIEDALRILKPEVHNGTTKTDK